MRSVHALFRYVLLAGVVLFGGITSSVAVSAEFPASPFAAAEEGEQHEEGIPGWQTDLALWSLVVFLIFIFLLRKFAWGPLIEGLNKRESQVRHDIAAAEDARKKAEQMLAEHQKKLESVQDEVREIIAEARRDAEHTKQEIVETAQKEADATKARSIAEIKRAKDAALKELFDTMATQVAEATEHVLGRTLNSDDQDRLIQEALSQFSQSS